VKRIEISWGSFIELLANDGWQEWDRGLFAKVYAHPQKDTVLKIYEDDKAYDRFLTKIKKLKNPYFPRIHSIHRYSDGDEMQWTVVELERLQRLTDEAHVTTETVYHQLKYEVDYDPFCDSEDDFDLDLSAFVESFDANNAKDKALKRAIQIIQDLGEDFYIDLHVDNVMLRKKKEEYQVVFIDPVYVQ